MEATFGVMQSLAQKLKGWDAALLMVKLEKHFSL